MGTTGGGGFTDSYTWSSGTGTSSYTTGSEWSTTRAYYTSVEKKPIKKSKPTIDDLLKHVANELEELC